MTEVQVLSGKSGYHGYTLSTATPLPETDDTVDVVVQVDQDWEPKGPD